MTLFRCREARATSELTRRSSRSAPGGASAAYLLGFGFAGAAGFAGFGEGLVAGLADAFASVFVDAALAAGFLTRDGVLAAFGVGFEVVFGAGGFVIALS